MTGKPKQTFVRISNELCAALDDLRHASFSRTYFVNYILRKYVEDNYAEALAQQPVARYEERHFQAGRDADETWECWLERIRSSVNE